jgi:diguanylate cyclase (GGDEF)-like protein
MVRSALALSTLPQVHVLLVEDNPSDAFLVENLLEEEKATEYKTHCVKTMSQAIAALSDQTFDVCLLDLTLPDADGFSALMNIQNKAPDVPVLILTGINAMGLAKRAVGSGAQDYLLKDEMEITGLSRAIDYAMERKRVQKDLSQCTNYDVLTGLANKQTFVGYLRLALARSERSGIGVSVLFINLDRFKSINDTYGHDAGDEILHVVAQRTKSALRAYDMLARFGSDEFAVLLEGIHSPRDAANISQKIIRSIAEPICYHSHSLEVSASIGVVFSTIPITPETLLQRAVTAVHHVKKKGGNAYHFYAESMQEEALIRLSLEEDLRTALEADELRLYYQPYVSPNDDAIIGIEALLRWAHPERGILSAHEFLPAAESARLMPRITAWTYEQLRHDIAMWNAKELPSLRIAINLSVSQLDAPNVVEYFTTIADQDFLGEHSLIVEIPEAAVTSMTEERFLTISKLHALGIGFHLDHYGSSSLPLATLTSVPFSLLKIDQSLIQNLSKEMSSDLLISAAIMLAHHLGMKVGAVGVETPEQATQLKAQNCDTMQGHLTASPVTAEKLAEWLAPRYAASKIN